LIDIYEPDCIATIDRLLRRTLVHAYRLSSLPTFITIINCSCIRPTHPVNSTQSFLNFASPRRGWFTIAIRSFLLHKALSIFNTAFQKQGAVRTHPLLEGGGGSFTQQNYRAMQRPIACGSSNLETTMVDNSHLL